MPLHLNWRPQNFSEFAGNTTTIKALESLFEARSEIKDYPHAFLFSGPSGCGKTTLARIVAKMLGCADMELVEVDVGDYRGIDTIRDIRQTMNYLPATGECRVWILDEFQQSTKDAQNALLKALEEAPAHVYFMLCTTEPEKLIKAVRTRTTQYDVGALPYKTIMSYMENIISQEGADVPLDAVQKISQESEGSMRQALVSLDKIIDMDKRDMIKALEQNLAYETSIFKLFDAIWNKNWNTASTVIQNLTEEPEVIRASFLTICANKLLKGGDTTAYLIMTCFKESFFYTKRNGLVLATYEAIQLLKSQGRG